jgi:hypothetical protein
VRAQNVLYSTRGIAVVVAISAVLAGALSLGLKTRAPIRTPMPARVGGGYVIMEGVDINSNGPGRSISDTPSERSLLSPPELLIGAPR